MYLAVIGLWSRCPTRLFCVRPARWTNLQKAGCFLPTSPLSLLLPSPSTSAASHPPSVSCSSCLLSVSLQTIRILPPLLMSDTCIVCLGDLGESASDPLAVAAEAAPRPDLQDADGHSTGSASKPKGVDGTEDAGQIAQLLPCGHILHNNCLKPWVERANSCPICRRSFNLVELSDRIGGIFLLSMPFKLI